MKLNGLVCPEAIVAKLKSTDRDGVITELVDSLVDAGQLEKVNRDQAVKAVIDRENEASTGIGKGVAVPHVKSYLVNSPVGAFGLSSEGVDFLSLDKQLVYSVFLVIGPEGSPEEHLSAMELIFKNLQKDDFRSFLRQSKSTEDVVTLLEEADRDEI
ncbi:PTS sugar transporter subunit IIA [Sedimentisphaera salicampi]|uniref:EIIABC-Fru n=1 Tax=Sedimentisphaera salicampi TaxID=1941349 RepID=A0A1W6LL39_9BACT|nr:PTS sugar transporter subunit IIA [Sedimentisphaera salicampi]ARN56475.1 EIIABC-Fru [Sedimentisphaera salicampi]OXU15361.1 EIIABC-Fru [Sedimentisphaera salicampi]